MPLIEYVPKVFSEAHEVIIESANLVCAAYRAQGYDLTLRQLYYQFVSRGWIANKDTEYKRLGSIINDARLAGRLDWDYITDRTRNLRSLAHWNDPTEIMRAVATQFRTDRWESQPLRIEVWIEKDALVGVIEGPCTSQDVPYFSCRGYTSQSEVWGAAQRIERYLEAGQRVLILHLGDHDPSGMDMSRDIEDRLRLFVEGDGLDADDLEVRRIALNTDQVRQYNPPPNPAKLTDSRVGPYIDRFGPESWELDALEPTVIGALITDNIEAERDEEAWEAATKAQETHREHLTMAHSRWDEVVEFLTGAA
jgi:hypothetical protein